jgi:hypothetical protein
MTTPAQAREGPRCSFLADAAADPRPGTAAPAQRWFLVEHPGPWGRQGFAESGLGPAAVSALSEWAVSEGGRVLLIRRPVRKPGSAPRQWFRVDSRPGFETVRTGVFADTNELASAVAAHGAEYDDALALVCVHGRHDTCCAVRGRPLAAQLAAADPVATWECSHVGGCRFAPALVLLPHGYVLGGVEAADGPDVVREYRKGSVDPRWLRGRSCFVPAVQAAQHEARLTTGAFGVDALRVTDVTSGGSRWSVRFADPDCTVVLRERRVAADRPLTCAATAPGWMRVFDVE